MIFCIVSLILISGCTQTGRVVEGNLTPEEELILREFLNQTPETQNETNTTENISLPVYRGHAEPQNITQPLGCPETCDDGDYCTYDYCSQETGYGCVHAERICPNTVEACPDGAEVICENICADDSCTTCDPDCSEHRLPSCGLTQDDCGQCRILDTGNCECALIISCVHNDECCPPGCDYNNDTDCEMPPDECSGDSECDDGNNCTEDRCQGIPKACRHEEITACTPGDGCCPGGCNHTNDTDCEEPEEPEATGDYLVINEIMYNPPAMGGFTASQADYYLEWVELYNPNDNDVNISGWNLCGFMLLVGYVDYTDKGTYSDSGTVIPAGGYAMVTDGGSGTDVYENFNAGPSSFAFHVNTSSICGNLGNSGDNVTLGHSNGTILESIEYSDDWGADGNNRTLERNAGDTWTESLADGGTPGSENGVS